MEFQKSLGFDYVQYGKSSTSTSSELLAMVCRDVEVFENTLEVFLDLFISDLIWKVSNEHLHNGKFDPTGKRCSSAKNVIVVRF